MDSELVSIMLVVDIFDALNKVVVKWGSMCLIQIGKAPPRRL